MARPAPLHPPPSERGLLLSLLLTLLVAMGPVSTDLYLPSLPGIARDLEAEPSLVQLTLGLFIGGLALMQLVYGPLSDRLGRRPVLLAAMALYVLATLACALAPSIGLLIAARFVQALGAGAGPVIGRAVVRDLYGPRDAARILSYMASAMAVAPLIAPFIGGWLEVAFGWRASFAFLLVYGGALGAALWLRLGETVPADRPLVGPAQLVRNYRKLLADPLYVGFLLCGACTFGGLFSWISNSSFVVIDRFGTAPQHFAWYFALTVFGYGAGAFLAGRAGGRLGILRTLGLGALTGALAGLGLLALAWLGVAGLAAITVGIAIYFAGCGLVLPQATAGALAPFPHMAGTAAALLGCMQMLTGMLANALSGLLFDGTEMPLVLLVAAFALGALAAFLLLVRPRFREAEA